MTEMTEMTKGGEKKQASRWVTTRCKVSGTPEQIREFRAFAMSGAAESYTQTIDFQRIIPVPPKISALAESFTKERLNGQSLADFAKSLKIPAVFLKTHNDKDICLYILARANNPLWNKWSMSHWGALRPVSSVNMIDEDDTYLDFSFDIMGGFPEPIFRALGKKFPEMEIWCAFYEDNDVDGGYGYFTSVRGGNAGREFSFCRADDMECAYSLVFDEEHPGFDDDNLNEDEETDNMPHWKFS